MVKVEKNKKIAVEEVQLDDIDVDLHNEKQPSKKR